MNSLQARNQSFQDTRLNAGRPATAGQGFPSNSPPLVTIGGDSLNVEPGPIQTAFPQTPCPDLEWNPGALVWDGAQNRTIADNTVKGLLLPGPAGPWRRGWAYADLILPYKEEANEAYEHAQDALQREQDRNAACWDTFLFPLEWDCNCWESRRNDIDKECAKHDNWPGPTALWETPSPRIFPISGPDYMPSCPSPATDPDPGSPQCSDLLFDYADDVNAQADWYQNEAHAAFQSIVPSIQNGNNGVWDLILRAEDMERQIFQSCGTPVQVP